jgi:hypothetical protein
VIAHGVRSSWLRLVKAEEAEHYKRVMKEYAGREVTMRDKVLVIELARVMIPYREDAPLIYLGDERY